MTCKQDVNNTLQNAISQLNLLEPMTVAEYVNFPEERIIGNSLEELLQHTKDYDSEEDDSAKETKVSYKFLWNT